MASVEMALILPPPGAEENVKNLSLPQVKILPADWGRTVLLSIAREKVTPK